MGGSPPTALQAAEPLSPAGVEKGEEKARPPPTEGEWGGGIRLLLLPPVADTRRRSRGTLQKPPPLPPPCQAAGREQPPPRRLPPRQPDLQLGVKVGPASRGWRHRPCLPRANRGRFEGWRATVAPWHQGSCRHGHSPPWQFSPGTLDFVPWAHPAVTSLPPGERRPASPLLQDLPRKPRPQPNSSDMVWVFCV